MDPALAWTEQAYAYVGGSPTNLIDPTGLQAEEVGEGIVEMLEAGAERLGEAVTETIERLFEENAEASVVPSVERSLNLPRSNIAQEIQQQLTPGNQTVSVLPENNLIFHSGNQIA